MAGGGIIKINVSPKFVQSDGHSQLQDIANQLAQLVYNKNMTHGESGCLGQAQNVHSRKINGKSIHVSIPTKIRGKDPKSVKLIGYINNVVHHCRKHGVNIKITS